MSKIFMTVTRYHGLKTKSKSPRGVTLWYGYAYQSRVRDGVTEAKADGFWIPLREGEFKPAMYCEHCKNHYPQEPIDAPARS